MGDLGKEKDKMVTETLLPIDAIDSWLTSL